MQFEIRHISVPFRFRYGHAKKQHTNLQGILCILSNDDGVTGLGEAVPRKYVTGETCESIMRSVEGLARVSALPEPKIKDATCQIKSRLDWATAWQAESKCTFPSCVLSAIDLARCDLVAQLEKTSLSNYLSGTPSETSNQVAKPYCASIGFGSGWKGKLKLTALLTLYKYLGFQHFKIKVGSDDDQARVSYIRRKLGQDAKIFADANAAWTKEQAAREIEMLAKYNIWAIEEPLQFKQAELTETGQVDRLSILDSQHYKNYAWLKERSQLPLIADESLICHESLSRVLEHNAFDILNLRLSKCGGPLLSMAMVHRAAEAGLRYSVAAMVGESPILATAGANFAVASESRHGIAPEYVQGYSHGLLHKIRFAFGEQKLKRASVQLDNSLGLGLRIDSNKLDSITVQKCQFQI